MMKVSNNEMRKALWSTFWRSFAANAPWELTRQEATGYAFSMVPSLRVIYKEDKNGKAQALQRHMQFFNITNVLLPLVLGTSIAMEEENKTNPDFDPAIINNVKVSLMGPLSAIGDSMFLTTWRVICMGISLALCQAGNILGPILFMASYNAVTIAVRWFGLKIGYEQGTKFIQRVSDSNIIQNISNKASILGMMVVGAMIPSYVVVNSPIKIGTGKSAVSLVSTLNQIVPSMLPLAATLIVLWMIRKKWKVSWILVTVVAFSIIGTWLHILSA